MFDPTIFKHRKEYGHMTRNVLTETRCAKMIIKKVQQGREKSE